MEIKFFHVSWFREFLHLVVAVVMKIDTPSHPVLPHTLTHTNTGNGQAQQSLVAVQEVKLLKKHTQSLTSPNEKQGWSEQKTKQKKNGEVCASV